MDNVKIHEPLGNSDPNKIHFDINVNVNVDYLDFQKVFDKVPHQRLSLKLKAHGIGIHVTNWIEKWLTHRKHRVILRFQTGNLF